MAKLHWRFRCEMKPISLWNLFVAASFCTVAERVSVSIIPLFFWPLKRTRLKICCGLLCPDLQRLQSQSRTLISSRSQGKIRLPHTFVCRCVCVYYTHVHIHGCRTRKFSSTLHLIKFNRLQTRLCVIHGCLHLGMLDTWTQKWDFSHSSSLV